MKPNVDMYIILCIWNMKSKLYRIYKYVRRRPNILIVSTMKLRSYYGIYIDAFGALSFCSICHTSPPPSFYHVAGSGYGYRFGHQNLPEFSRNICGDDTRAHTHRRTALVMHNHNLGGVRFTVFRAAPEPFSNLPYSSSYNKLVFAYVDGTLIPKISHSII